jgi:hydrogenase maturation protein HypF
MTEGREVAERIRVCGLVQGVGFRPTTWRLAHRYRVRGWVANDAGGVSMHIAGLRADVDAFVRALRDEAPPLARIDGLDREATAVMPDERNFVIAPSNGAPAIARGGIVPDAATCATCMRETLDPTQRRHRYPFTNCTHCGPRLSIVRSIPYDRATTTMQCFPMCQDCIREYTSVQDRRFHAEPIACPACGPQVWLERGGEPLAGEAIAGAAALIDKGFIVGIKGLGGFQLACDAGGEAVVARLRAAKHRVGKPFALMVRDMDVLRRWCHMSRDEEALLASPAAPIVVLERRPDAPALASGIAAGISTLGVMLPNTPLHHLLLQGFERPIVLTSGNLTDEPQCIDDSDARTRLGAMADAFLRHDRKIARRVDDSVQRIVAGVPRVLRRARGFAPASLRLPRGFESAPSVLALGGELKNTFCLLRDGEAILSHHIGDLDDAATHADFLRALQDYRSLFEHRPSRIAVDLHPDALSTQHGEALAGSGHLPLIRVQHHHAHIASCLADNGWPLDGAPVLGIALDGFGFGADGVAWGGEFLRADYRRCERVGSLQPVPMPGGDRCASEPWRNTYAHLVGAIGWPRVAAAHAGLELVRFLRSRPLSTLDSMMAARVNSPLSSSCGRLFDAVAAATGVCREQVSYEGQAAIELEALVGTSTAQHGGYPFSLDFDVPLPTIGYAPLWQALLADLEDAAPAPRIAARFHAGLASALARMAAALLERERDCHPGFAALALSGGVFQNRVLVEALLPVLAKLDLPVLTQHQLPCHDGGLALGQAVIAAAAVA